MCAGDQSTKALLKSIRAMVLNLFAEGSQIQTVDFVRELHYKNFLTQVN